MTPRPADEGEALPPPVRVVLLSDGIAGHFRQSEGVVAAIERIRPVVLTRIELPKRVGPVRFLLSLATRLGLPLPLSWHLGKHALPHGTVDLVLSAGGRTLAANVALARLFKAPNLFSGSPRQFPVSAFSRVLLSYPAPAEKGLYILKPTALDPDGLPRPKKRAETSAQSPWRIALLLGGPTEPCPWNDRDWQAMLALAVSIAANPALRLVAVTSRRTPTAWADALQKATEGLPGLERIVDYRTAGPGSISVAYGCDAMVVSGDSMSMVTEAVAARRPVAVLMPDTRNASRDDATMDDLEAQQRIRLTPAASTTAEGLLGSLDALQPMQENHLDRLADVACAVTLDTTGKDVMPGNSPRILQLLPALGDGGVERSAVEMAGYLSSKELANWIVSSGGPLVEQAEKLGARHVRIAVGSKSPFGMIAAARKVARLIDEQEIDIVHARSRAPAWVALIALKLARRKARYVTTFHGVYSHGNALKRFYNSAMLRTPVVIANSLFIRDHIISVYGYPATQIVVAPRGIEPLAFDPASISSERRAAVRAELGGSARPLVVMVGRITGWKGHTVLVDAIARMARKDVDFAFIGSGIDSVIAELKAKVGTLGIADRVHFVGSRRDIPAVLAAADLAVSASTRPEAFGRAAIEAQAMGLPVIATDHGGSRETVIAGKTGWLVPPGDAEAMAKAIDEALSDPVRRAQMGANGRENVLAHFTTEAMLQKEYSGYSRVLALPEPR